MQTAMGVVALCAAHDRPLATSTRCRRHATCCVSANMNVARLLGVAGGLASAAACGRNNSSDGCIEEIAPGDLVITEAFTDPAGNDEGLEWFEVLNTSTRTIDLTKSGESRQFDGGGIPNLTLNDELFRGAVRPTMRFEFPPGTFGTPGAPSEDCKVIHPRHVTPARSVRRSHRRPEIS